jgi:hypothetical protein
MSPLPSPAGPVALLVLLAALVLPGPIRAESPDTTETAEGEAARTETAEAARAEADLFAMPGIADALRLAGAMAAGGGIEEARGLVEDLAARHPALGSLQASRAALAMLAGEPEAALEALEAAAEAGTPDIAAIAGAPLFAPLAADPARAARLAAVAASPAPPEAEAEPAAIEDGIAPVGPGNTRWNPGSERLEAVFAPAEAPAGPVLAERPVTAAHDLLREHWRRGRAAGLHGDLYDNRDRGHSRLDPELFPQLARIEYPEAARRAGIDYGLNDRILFDRITFGNSSTALTAGPHWRSLPRHALTRPDGTGPMRLWQTAQANHLYVHPAHEDWGRERGDLFPANAPYLLVSRGSSGSDRPFLEAIGMILAALPPATKARLAEERLVVPTVQMIFRRSLQPIRSRESYLSGAAHPAVFEGRDINLARMVSLAQAIAPDALPAEARLAVIEEAPGEEGRDFFGTGLSEQIFDTPSAVARIWRSSAGRRSMLLSAEASRDANGRPLAFEWRLLQGDPDRVRIEPEDGGARARVTIEWHDPFPRSATDRQTTTRVDIGVFAHNGVHDSAPAILSWYFPPNETRIYETGPDGAPRIAAIKYADPAKAGIYADPLLVPRAEWRDVYAYAEDGTPLGWTRERTGRQDAFAPDGTRILTTDAAGRPLRTEPVAYPLGPGPDGTILVQEISADR